MKNRSFTCATRTRASCVNEVVKPAPAVAADHTTSATVSTYTLFNLFAAMDTMTDYAEGAQTRTWR